MPYKIRIITPVHIGCGETYNGLSYLVDVDILYFIPMDRFIDFLDGRAYDFTRWLERHVNEIERLEERKRSERNRDEKSNIEKELRSLKESFNLKTFIENNKISKEDIKKISLYSIKTVNAISNSNDINSFIKQMGQIYIPGTEIKGAIRTAILYCAICDNKDLYNQLKQKIEDFGGKYRFFLDAVKNEKNLNIRLEDKISKIPEEFQRFKNWTLSRIKERILCEEMGKISSNIENQILNAKFNINIKKADAKYDILKFLNVGDSELKRPDEVMSIARVIPFNIYRSFTLYNEIVIPETDFVLTDFKVEKNEIMSKKIKKVDFDERQSNLVGNIEKILGFCYRFSKDLIDEEIKYFNLHNKKEILKHLYEMANINRQDSPIIRLGKDEGFLSITVALAIKKHDTDLYKNVFIHAIKGKSYEKDLMPKTRKIVEYNGRQYTPGWIQLFTG